MPTYDYVCDECQHSFELFQSITEPAKKKCPVCGRLRLRRLIGPGAAILFKGTGFYQTDYRSPSYQKDAKAAAESSSKTKSKGEKTTSTSGSSDDATS